jgi:hypothetical protein
MENQRLPLGRSSAHPVTPPVLTDTLIGAPILATRAISQCDGGVSVREVDQGGASPDGIDGGCNQRQRSKIAEDDRPMSSSPINEVSVQINPDPLVATLGEASEVSSRATTSIEHRRRGLKKCLEG